MGPEFKGVKGQAAIEKLLKEKKGHVKGAFTRTDIGDIDLVWGDKSGGLSHIVSRREEQGLKAEDFLRDLTEVVQSGDIRPGRRGRLEIKHKNKTAVILPEYDGQEVKLVLTAFENKKEPEKPE